MTHPITHAAPPGLEGLTPCCRVDVLALPRTDRLSLDPRLVDCRVGMSETYRRAPPRVRTLAVLEDDFLEAVTQAASTRGWRWHHVRRSDRAAQMGHPGFPDLVLVRGGRALALELKGSRGRVAEAQIEWIVDLAAAGLEASVVRPSDLDDVLDMLK